MSLKDDYLEVFSSTAAQRVLADMVAKLGYLRSESTSEDPYKLYANASRRNFAVHLVELSGVSLGALEKAMKDNRSQK